MTAPAAPAMTTVPHVPRAVEILAAVGLLLAANRWAPGVVPAVLALVALYALLTYTDRASSLLGILPSTLQRGYGYPYGGAPGPARIPR